MGKQTTEGNKTLPAQLRVPRTAGMRAFLVSALKTPPLAPFHMASNLNLN